MTPSRKAAVAVAALGTGLGALLLSRRSAAAGAGGGSTGGGSTGGGSIPIIPAPVPGGGSTHDPTRGDATIAAYQQRLYELGYDPGPIDGRYGHLTQNAVRDFQRDSGLTVDGILGPRTKAAIDGAYGAPMPTSGLPARPVGGVGGAGWRRY